MFVERTEQLHIGDSPDKRGPVWELSVKRQPLKRRQFLVLGAAALAIPQPTLVTASEDSVQSIGFPSYADLLQTISKRGQQYRVLGYAPDGSAVVAVKAGGDKKPAILISAGSHSTEHAGVVAAVDLINELQTEHEVYVLPCRDPMGLSGFRHVLALSLGKKPTLSSLDDALRLLREKGQVLYDEGDRLLVQIGEYGYASNSFYRQVDKGAPFLESLRGRRIFFPSRHTDQPGAAPLARAYTQIITPDAEVLHLNRFHDTIWAPVEVQCLRRLMSETQPRLTFDLHEYGGSDFWMSARRQQTEEDEVWELRMARAGAGAVAAAGASFPEEDYRPGSFFDKLEPGVFWLNPQQRGEGLNLADFAARHYGPSFTIETGMRQDFEKRLLLQKTVVQAIVQAFEDRYR